MFIYLFIYNIMEMLVNSSFIASIVEKLLRAKTNDYSEYVLGITLQKYFRVRIGTAWHASASFLCLELQFGEIDGVVVLERGGAGWIVHSFFAWIWFESDGVPEYSEEYADGDDGVCF